MEFEQGDRTEQSFLARNPHLGNRVLSTFLTRVKTQRCFSQMLYRCTHKALMHLRQEKKKEKLMYCTAPCTV